MRRASTGGGAEDCETVSKTPNSGGGVLAMGPSSTGREYRDVTIVIRTWNALDYLKLTYESAMAGLDSSLTYEVICVDDNSDVATLQYLEHLPCDTLILNRTRRGVTGGTSQGHRLARGRYVAIVDSDVILPRRWLGDLVKDLERFNGAIISSARFSGLRHPTTGEPLRFAWNRVKREHRGLPPAALFAVLSEGRTVEEFGELVLRNAGRRTSEVVCPPDCVGSSCMVYDRAFVDRVGGTLTLSTSLTEQRTWISAGAWHGGRASPTERRNLRAPF